MKKLILLLSLATGLLLNGTLNLNNLTYFYEVESGYYNEQTTDVMRNPQTGERTLKEEN